MTPLESYALSLSALGGLSADVTPRVRLEVETLDFMAKAAGGPYVMQRLRIHAMFSQWSGFGGSFAPGRMLRWNTKA